MTKDQKELRQAIARLYDEIREINNAAVKQVEEKEKDIKRLQSRCKHSDVDRIRMISCSSCCETIYRCNIYGHEREGR